MSELVNFIRGITRPAVTLLLVAVLCAVVVRLVWSTVIPSLPVEVWVGLFASFTTAVTVAMAFWFASRNTRPPGTP